MKRSVSLLFITLIIPGITLSQIINQFDWNSGSPVTATFGANAASVSSSAIISSGGAGGSNGLNAGLPKLDLNLTITATADFNMAGIDLQFDYQRDESTGTFIQRGSSLIMAMNAGALTVSYRVDNGAGSYTTVSSGNTYTIPNDDVWRTYRFRYNPNTGVGELLVNGVSQWSNNGADNRNMYWTGAGANVVIGAAMDGAGLNKAFFDNFYVANIAASPLPIHLTTFSANMVNTMVQVIWSTASETDNDYFTVERSFDNSAWDEISRINGAGNSTGNINYSITDKDPLSGTVYYRLKQVDYNGDFTYPAITSIKIPQLNRRKELYPNPAVSEIIIETEVNLSENLLAVSQTGNKVLITATADGPVTRANVENLKPGIYMLFDSNMHFLGKFVRTAMP